jgi:cation diffusion facilitator CzcD-associated flavoprotein CzcO
MVYDALIVGAGAAGIGCGAAFRHLGIERFALLDRYGAGASFDRWPGGMRFITPSFTSNAFGMLDLNAVAPRTSPAFTLKTEHPTGKEYARYLRAVAKYFELPVKRDCDVTRLEAAAEGFLLHTSRGKLRAKFVVWAAGEFLYPRRPSFRGAQHCVHSSAITDWNAVANEEAVVIGGYESGADAAFQLAAAGKRVRLLDRGSPWKNAESDPSVALSPFTRDRLRSVRHAVELIPRADVVGVSRTNGHFHVIDRGGRKWRTDSPPVLATGFSGGLELVREHFAWSRQGHVKLSSLDESTRTPGLFVAGPQIRHGGVIFCFIYKFRQRFAVVAGAIAERLGVSTEPLGFYRSAGMFLDDLSCCGEECAC